MATAAEILWRYRWPNGMRDMCTIVQSALQRWRQDRRKDGRPQLLGLEHLQWITIEEALAMPCVESGLPALSKKQRDEISDKRLDLVTTTKGELKRSDHARDQLLRAAYQDPLIVRHLGGRHGTQRKLLELLNKEGNAGYERAVRVLKHTMCELTDPTEDGDVHGGGDGR